MIAAVVDRRGRGVARERLVLARSSWSEIHESATAVVARSADAPSASTARASIALDEGRRLRGTSALVGLDADADGVVLARGALGGRPLYYARFGEGFAACSSLAGLLRMVASEGRPAVDADRLASIVAGAFLPDVARTPYAGVARVAPCEAVRLSASGVERAARPREAREAIDARTSVDDLAAELWRRFVASVERAIGPRRSVAVMVGGGVDSSGLLAAAVAVARGGSPREVAALALDFDAEGSDRRYLEDLSRALGVVPVRLAPRDAGSFWRRSFVVDAQPYVLTIGAMEQLVFTRARGRGAEVLLSGYLADDILAGDLRALATDVLAGAPLGAVGRALRVRLPWEMTSRERVSSWVVRPLLKPLVPRRLLARLAERREARDVPWAGPRTRRVLAELAAWAAAQPAPLTPEARFDRFARSGMLADYADWRGQIETATGLVREDPYADEDVLDLMARVPPRALVHGDLYRGLFRVALRGRVPESIRLRTDKCAFEPAFAEAAAAGGGVASLGDLWSLRALASLDILDPRAFRPVVEPLFRDPSSTATAAEAWSWATQALACEAFAQDAAERREEAA